MDENKLAAEEKVENTEVEEVAATDQENAPVEAESDADFNDGEEGSTEETAAEAPKPKQTREENAEFARRRREEEQQRAIAKAKEEAVIDALDGINPYTGQPIKDRQDVEEFFAMRDIKKRGGDPLTDYPEYLKQREREREAEKVREAEQAAWYRTDRDRFLQEFPDVNLEELIKDEHFQVFADGKVGNVPLVDIYRSYTALQKDFENRSEERAAQRLANKKASPGALRNGSTPDTFYTRDQVRQMSQEEVHANYDKIRKSMEKWK